MTANSDLGQLDRATDPLYQVIKKCPNVKEVSFSIPQRIYAEDWLYFFAVLSENSTWKLQKIPVPNNHLFSPCYCSCAYHMRNSLTELHLKTDMIRREDYGVLAEFKQLKALYFGKNILRDLFDFDSILKYLPQLTKFEVEGFQHCNNMEVYLTIKRGTISTTRYSNIKSLNIKNFGN